MSTKRSSPPSEEAHDEMAGKLGSITEPSGGILGSIPDVFYCTLRPCARFSNYGHSVIRNIRGGTLNGRASIRDNAPNSDTDSIADGPNREMISQNHSADGRAAHRRHPSGTHGQLHSSAVAFLLLLHLLDGFALL